MKTAICLTAYRRRNELRSTVASINEALQHELVEFMVAGIDPIGGGLTRNIANDVHEAEIEKTVFIHPRRLLIDMNLRHCIDYAFEQGAEAIIRLADDTPISPDLFRLVKWYTDGEQEYINQTGEPKYVALMFHNYGCRSAAPEHWRPLTLFESRGDEALEKRKDGCRWHGEGFAFTKASWDRWLRDHFWFRKDDPHHSFQGAWSGMLNRDAGLQFLVPELSRSTHIGRTGGGCNTLWYDEVYTDVVVADRVYQGPFEIERNHAESDRDDGAQEDGPLEKDAGIAVGE